MNISPAIIIDVALIAVIVVSVFHYARKGFVAGLMDLVGNLASLALAWVVSGKLSPTVIENFFKSGLIEQTARTLQQQGGGPGGSSRRAGAGGIAAAQPLPPHRDIELQFPHVCPPFDAKRPSSRLRRALIPGYTAPLHLRATQLPLCSGSPGLRFLLRRAFSAPLGQWLVHLRPRLQ